jgi:alkanesulfonate monooxygenase
MTIDIYWQLDTAAEPARGERSRHRRIASIAREVRTATQGRFDYYAQIAQGAAQTAFDGLFLPHREEADDSLIVAAALAREVQRLALVAQFPASVGSAVYAAKQAVSFQRATGNRLGWAISPDADIAARAGGADHVREEELGARAEEFLAVARGVHGESPFSFTGRHFEVQGGGFEVPLNRAAFPQVFFEGHEEDELDLSARLADVHLFRDTSFPVLRERIETLDAAAARHGRTVRFGLIQEIVARETGEEARAEARRANVSQHALVGDYAAVADELAARVALGISHIILIGSPSLTEVYRSGQHVLPRLRARLTETRQAA